MAVKKIVDRKPMGKMPEVKKAAVKEISVENMLEEIQKRAFEIYLERGRTPGEEMNDWLQAEKDIKSKYKIKG